MPGRWVKPWSGPWSSCWHCLWCLWTSVGSETCSNQLSMVKNKYLDTKINLLQCQGAELHIDVALDHVVEIVLVVDVHWGVLKPVPINSAWSKTYIWTPRSTFHDARELSYTLKWLWTLLLALLVVLGTSGCSETCYNQLSMVKNLYLDTKINLLWCHRAELHNFPNIRVSGTFPGLPSHFWRYLEIKKVAPNLVSCRSRCI